MENVAYIPFLLSFHGGKSTQKFHAILLDVYLILWISCILALEKKRNDDHYLLLAWIDNLKIKINKYSKNKLLFIYLLILIMGDKDPT